jgi:hypothetical protein
MTRVEVLESELAGRSVITVRAGPQTYRLALADGKILVWPGEPLPSPALPCPAQVVLPSLAAEACLERSSSCPTSRTQMQGRPPRRPRRCHPPPASGTRSSRPSTSIAKATCSPSRPTVAPLPATTAGQGEAGRLTLDGGGVRLAFR